MPSTTSMKLTNNLKIKNYVKRYQVTQQNLINTRKNSFACLFSVHNTISLLRHQVCLTRLRFER